MLDSTELRTPESSSLEERELRRELRRPQVLAIVVGAIVGAGIYIRPASIAAARVSNSNTWGLACRWDSESLRRAHLRTARDANSRNRG